MSFIWLGWQGMNGVRGVLSASKFFGFGPVEIIMGKVNIVDADFRIDLIVLM